MKKLLFLVAVGYGAWQWSGGQLPSFSPVNAFDESGNPVVKVYTVAGCGKPCERAVNELKSRRVNFEVKALDVENEADEDVQLWEKVGRNSFPLIVSGEEKINGSGTPAQIATLLALNYEDQYLSRSEKRYFKKHFNADGSPKIVVYGTSWCPWTKKLREELQASNVDFVEIDVERNQHYKNIIKTMGIEGYPATWVGYTRVNGTNLKSVETTLKKY